MLEQAVAIGEARAIGPTDLLFARTFLAIAVRERDPRRARRLAAAVIEPLIQGTDGTSYDHECGAVEHGFVCEQ